MSILQGYKPHLRNVLVLAIPVVVSQLGQQTVQLVDSFMVGRLTSPTNPSFGSESLASISFANSLVMPVIILGIGFAMGLTPLTGRANVRGDFERTTSLLKNSLTMNLLFAAVMTAILLLGSFFLDTMGQDPKIIPLARQYYFYMTASILPLMLFFTGRQFLEGLGNTTYAMIIVLITNLLNVALNFCLIYGLWFFTEMGPLGAGVATFYSRVAQFVMFTVLLTGKEKFRKYLLNFRNVTLSKFRMRRLLNIGLPISIQLFVEMLVFSLMAIVIGTFGAKELAAHQIAINIPSTAFMVILGVQSATTIMVSRNFGLRLYDDMKASFRAAQVIIVAFMTVSMILIAVFALPIAGLFTKEADVAAMAARFLLLGALFQIPDGLQGVGIGALRGMTIVKKPMYYNIFIYIFVAVPISFISMEFMGAYGTWVGFIAALTIFAILYNRLFIKKLGELKLNSNNY